MKSISKIVVLFFIPLISYINLGLLKSDSFRGNLTGESIPSYGHFSFQDIFLCPLSDLVIKNNVVPGQPDKILQKIKIPWGIRSGAIIIKNHLYIIKREGDDPALRSDLFGQAEISFPFNYFW